MQIIFINFLDTTHSIAVEGIEPQGLDLEDFRLNVGRLYEMLGIGLH